MKKCVCLITKDSTNYIEEFVEWHHDYCGFDDIIIVEDIDSEPLDEILSKYNYVQLYKLINIMNDEDLEVFKKIKDKAIAIYNIFYRLRKNYDWMAYIDDDEFIDMPAKELDLILEKNTDKPCVTMDWLIMKCDGHIYHPNNGKKYSIINTYTSYTTNPLDDIYSKKQIINCNKKFDEVAKLDNWDWAPHKMVKENNFDGNIKLKHFKYKSFEEYYNLLMKRGECSIQGTSYHRKFEDWFNINNEYKDQKEKLYKEFNIQSEDNVKFSNFDFIKNI